MSDSEEEEREVIEFFREDEEEEREVIELVREDEEKRQAAEKIFVEYLRKRVEVFKAMYTLVDCLKAVDKSGKDWFELREETIEEVRKVRDEINENREIANVVDLVTGTAGYCGGLVALTGITVALATGGLAAPAISAGMAISSASRVTSASVKITEKILECTGFNKAKAAIKADRKLFKPIHMKIRRLSELQDELKELVAKLENLEKELWDLSSDFHWTASEFAKYSNVAICDIIQFSKLQHGTPGLVEVLKGGIIGKIGTKALEVGASSMGFPIGRAVVVESGTEISRSSLKVAAAFTTAGIVADVHQIVTSAEDLLVKGSPSESADKLDRACDILEEHKAVVRGLFRKAKKMIK